MEYPLFACAPNGFCQLFKSQVETQRMPIGYLGIFKRYQSILQFFDSGGVVWKLERAAALAPISLWRRLFGSLKEIDVKMEFSKTGTYAVEDIKIALRRAVEADDDILTQFERRDKILERLDRIQTVADAFQLYRWMRKDFKNSP